MTFPSGWRDRVFGAIFVALIVVTAIGVTWTMRQTYLAQNLLYRSGEYLSPAELSRIAS